jgi:hypothetical protein
MSEGVFDNLPAAMQALRDAGVRPRVLHAIELAMSSRAGAESLEKLPLGFLFSEIDDVC